jgi:hypothetical protein
MPAVFDKLGIRFVYPENWKLDESEAMSGEDTVTVYTPDGSFWMVRVLPPKLEPSMLVDKALETMRREYQDLDAEPFDDTFGDCDVVGCEMNFYCLDLTNTAVVKSYRTPQATIVVLHQAEDRELANLGKVFEAMTFSLMQATIGQATPEK